VFRLQICREIPATLRRDLARAGILYQDDAGRRVDLHALRVTFGTNLVLRGAHPRIAQEFMRHSDVRLTMPCQPHAFHPEADAEYPDAAGYCSSFAVGACEITVPSGMREVIG
jgi:hypothetical protein